MELIQQQRVEQVDAYVSLCMAAQILDKPASILALATGNTTEPIYRVFTALVQESGLDVSGIRASVVDEYTDISVASPLGCRNRLQRLFVDTGLLEASQLIAPRLKSEIPLFTSLLDSLGPFDLQILGVGANGHLGFNEPGADPSSLVHEVPLTEETRKVLEKKYSQRGIHEPIPLSGITMGLKPILQAREIILVAKGREKADVVKALYQGPIEKSLPASFLQLHPRCKLVVDEEAACKL
ncbi:6-phosphogluconolactonase [uncultured Sphaerochaeta sp.]|uniref:6-phosphogluconolactonase n=1 Tax=uncultured Sphaerochaeta sp. TaxID=886478 RepID=UPI002A0A6E17|nr:6-phosphogluconolactonase [uncultured Sphaerochaeta sp.]